MSKEAMKLALDAFETLTQYNMARANIFRQFHPTATGDYVDLQEFREKALPAIAAIREALAEESSGTEQPAPVTEPRKQEPDLSGLKPSTQEAIKGWIEDGTFIERAIRAMQEQEVENMRLEKMVAPQPAPVQQEPVAWTVAGEVKYWSMDFSKHQTQHYVRPLYALPPVQQEPVAWMHEVNNGGGYSSRSVDFHKTSIPFAKHTPLYTAPPAQRKPLSVLMITTAYEQGVGKGQQAYRRKEEIENPYTPGECYEAWQLGYKEGMTQAKDIETTHGIKGDA